MLPIGDHFTMGPREAALALELLGNPDCVPCHYGTFPLLERDAGGARRERRRLRVHRLEPGETTRARLTPARREPQETSGSVRVKPAPRRGRSSARAIR